MQEVGPKVGGGRSFEGGFFFMILQYITMLNLPIFFPAACAFISSSLHCFDTSHPYVKANILAMSRLASLTNHNKSGP